MYTDHTIDIIDSPVTYLNPPTDIIAHPTPFTTTFTTRRLCQLDLKHRPTKRYACPLILASRQPSGDLLNYMLACGANPNYVHRTLRVGGQASGGQAGSGVAADTGGQEETKGASRKGDSLTPLQVGRYRYG